MASRPHLRMKLQALLPSIQLIIHWQYIIRTTCDLRLHFQVMYGEMSFAASIKSSLSELNFGTGRLEERLDNWRPNTGKNSSQNSEYFFVLRRHKALYQVTWNAHNWKKLLCVPVILSWIISSLYSCCSISYRG